LFFALTTYQLTLFFSFSEASSVTIHFYRTDLMLIPYYHILSQITGLLALVYKNVLSFAHLPDFITYLVLAYFHDGAFGILS